MSKKKHRTKAKGEYAGHQKVGSKLLPLLARGLPIVLVDYERDLLPEHLWIGALVDQYGIEGAHRPYYELLDVLDQIWSDDYPPLGLLSDFATVPENARATFKEKHRELILRAFHEPIGRILAFYPEAPGHWLIDQQALTDAGSLDPEKELTRASNLVIQLIAAKDDFAGHARMLPLGRVMKHGKLHLPEGFSLADALTRYPDRCTDDERWGVQSLGRSHVNELYGRLSRYASKGWPQYFWRHNFDLVPCDLIDLPLRGSEPMNREAFAEVERALGENAENARAYLDRLSRQAKIDLYEPLRDEILLGIFSRCVRLYVLMAEDPNLWARDISGILLRCLADTAITFGYLAKRGVLQEFQRFREYGQGQEKLLMLHLQESYPDDASLEGRTAAAIGQDLGILAPALLQVELGSWSGKDTRTLAYEAGMERLYRLIFAPGSGDVHGTWASLARSNLAYCRQPLHRFHRLPSFSEPPFFLDTMIAAQNLLESCISIGIESQGFPLPAAPFARLGPETS